MAHEGEERAVVSAPRHELISGRRCALLFDVFEKIKLRPLQVGQLDELDELRGAVIGQRAGDGRVDVVHVDLVPANEVLQGLERGRRGEEAGEEAKVAIQRRVQFLIGILVQKLAIHLRGVATEQRSRVRLEAPIKTTQLREPWAHERRR